MKLPYENELYELRKWIDNTNATLNMQFIHMPQEIQRVRQWINAIAKEIQTEYPFYAAMLPGIANMLFQLNEVGTAFLNPGAFGELVVIICHIEAEPVVVGFWSAIHPQIVSVSRELYVDGHCSTAAEKAVKEVESRLREKFSELKPGAVVPLKIGEVIGALIARTALSSSVTQPQPAARTIDAESNTCLKESWQPIVIHLLMPIFNTKNARLWSKLCWQAS